MIPVLTLSGVDPPSASDGARCARSDVFWRMTIRYYQTSHSVLRDPSQQRA